MDQAQRNNKCDTCQRCFSTKQVLRDHERIHTGERPFMCTFQKCAKSFNRSSSLSKHLRLHKGVKPYECSNCLSRFSDKSNLLRHNRMKHEEFRPFSCQVCEKTFSSRSNLGQHQAIHQERSSFLCEAPGCDKSFLYKSNLRKHQSTHCFTQKQEESCFECVKKEDEEGTPIFVCYHREKEDIRCQRPGCGQQFQDFSVLEQHELLHNKFRCDDCKRGFSTNFNLRKHFQTHQEYREKYSCEETKCGKVFLYKSSLNKHRRKHRGAGQDQPEQWDNILLDEVLSEQDNEIYESMSCGE